MKAFAVTSPDGPELSEIEIAEPELSGREVLVDVTHAGVCHTDLHLRSGGYDLGSAGFLSLLDRGVQYPLIMGHEIAGTVRAVGDEVTDLQVGQQVVVYPWLGCGECATCLTGNENQCPVKNRGLGVALHGGYADAVWVPDAKYCVSLDGIDPEWGATLACSGVTAYSAARKVSNIPADHPILVIGAGGVGLTAIATLHALGHENIVVVDRHDGTFQYAKELGATKTAVIGDETNGSDIGEIVGEKPAAIIDFVNSTQTSKLAFDSIRRAGTIVQVGLFGGELRVPTALTVIQQVSIIGSYVGGLNDLRAVVDLAKEGKLPRSPIATAELSLDSLNGVLTAMEDGRSRGRTVLVR
ncbi:alcohol dehydrogenase [Gulosibacter molinativorax]|uniref:Alcohol dehydrogenase n=2 Tax=Gulosibacter molinativorax TaxID=256821 RepID=A0ABT7C6N9_9MICO|nr:alcohol dehydrogenase [Gulosibacter molinativorax]QUY62199.1 Alcohol dehydrogenase [Gulosibacter molinativorax]